MPHRQPRLSELVVIALALTTGACGSSGTGGTHTTPAAVSLSETGSTLLYPLFNQWGPAYKQNYPNVTITAQGTGSGTGVSQAAADAVDIGASDAYLSEGDMKEHPGLMNIALTVSAQQINYNVPGVTDPIKLDGQVVLQPAVEISPRPVLQRGVSADRVCALAHSGRAAGDVVLPASLRIELRQSPHEAGFSPVSSHAPIWRRIAREDRRSRCG